MPRITTKSTTMARMAIHAPCVNFVISTTTRTVPVTVSPRALIVRLVRIRRRRAASCSVRRRRFQWMTIPVWLAVNETKTPTMYSWMSRVTSASKATMSTIEATASSTTPLL